MKIELEKMFGKPKVRQEVPSVPIGKIGIDSVLGPATSDQIDCVAFDSVVPVEAERLHGDGLVLTIVRVSTGHENVRMGTVFISSVVLQRLKDIKI
jgi:hypothetical protein